MPDQPTNTPQDTTAQGSLYTFYPVVGDANNYIPLPNSTPPPPVTATEINRQTDNTIRTMIQPVIPPAPPDPAQILNGIIPNPTEPSPVTPQQITGAGIPLSEPPPPVTATDFNRNVNSSGSAAPPDPSLNGDSNVAGGVASGTPNASSVGGSNPGSGTIALQALNPGANNPINSVLGMFGNGSTPWTDMFMPPTTSDYQKPTTGESAYTNSLNQSDAAGRRVRLRPKPAGSNMVYGNGTLLSHLRNTNGMVWPYQPLIAYQQSVDYKSMELTHSNQDIYSYHRTPSLSLNVDGEFSVQNQEEGLYAVACIHFLRTISKMNFGESDKLKGTPPPVLLFDAYGTYMFNALPVIVTQFTIGLPKDVDYVPIDMSKVKLSSSATGTWADLTRYYLDARNTKEISWLPAVFNIQVQLTVQNSPTRLRTFNLNEFRNGSLMKQGGWV